MIEKMEEINEKNQTKRSLTIGFENLIDTLMTLVDTLTISVLGPTAIGAIGAMGVVLSILQMSPKTINVSNNTLVANAIGEKNINKTELLTGNAVIMTLIISIITIAITYLIQPILPNIFNVDIMCNQYLTIRLFGFVQTSIVTVLSGYQRTIGNQGKILGLRIFAVILNLLLDILAVRLGYGISGVAWATVLIDTLLAGYLILISRKNVKYKFVKNYFKQIFNLFKWNFVERIATRVDALLFDIIAARVGKIEYAVHVIVMQIANIYESFVQGFGDGITITVGIAVGSNDEKQMNRLKQIGKTIIKKSTIVFPIIIFIISIVVSKISLTTVEMKQIFISIIPLIILGTALTTSATYYFSILRGKRDFAFLAKRNVITSVIKIILAFLLSHTPLKIVGVWIAYLSYGLSQKYLSKKRYKKIFIKTNEDIKGETIEKIFEQNEG